MKEYTTKGIEEAVREGIAGQKVPNILICGQTGAGKSSAVNFIFNDSVATVGDFEPCTTDVNLFRSNYINIYDSEGYEIGSDKQKHYKKMLLEDFLLTKQAEFQGDGAVHLVWYTISAAGKRFTDVDIDLIKNIKKAGFKLCILLTKIDGAGKKTLDEMLNGLQTELPHTEIFKLSTDKDADVQALCDWTALIRWSYNELPEVYKDRFVASLRAGLEEKRMQAEKATSAYAWKPLLDPVPHQAALIIRILSIYNLKVNRLAVIEELSTDSLREISALIEKILAVAEELIPPEEGISAAAKAGAGVAKHLVRIGSSTALIMALGKSVSSLCYLQCKAMLEGQEVQFDIEEILKAPNFLKNMLTTYKTEKIIAAQEEKEKQAGANEQ